MFTVKYRQPRLILKYNRLNFRLVAFESCFKIEFNIMVYFTLSHLYLSMYDNIYEYNPSHMVQNTKIVYRIHIYLILRVVQHNREGICSPFTPFSLSDYCLIHTIYKKIQYISHYFRPQGPTILNIIYKKKSYSRFCDAHTRCKT